MRRLQGKGTFVNERPKVHRTMAVIAPYLYANESPDFRAGTDVIPILMQTIEHHARKQGVGIMLYLDNLDPETERENILNVIERKVDAVLHHLHRRQAEHRLPGEDSGGGHPACALRPLHRRAGDGQRGQRQLRGRV